jgi:mRNA interferase RelE/StbE
VKTAFRKSFVRDLKKIKDNAVLRRIRSAIVNAEAATDLSAVGDLAKLAGTRDCYRILVGEYRIGVVVTGSTIEFVRCLSRRDLYRFFP